MRARTTWLSEDEKSLILEEALHVLEHTGMRMAGSQALPRWRRPAPRSTPERARALPARAGDRGAGALPARVRARGCDGPSATPPSGPARTSSAAPSGCAAHALDLETGRRRESTLEDLRTHIAVLDELENLDVQWTSVTANDVPREQRELREYLTVLTETGKHVTFVDCPTHVEEVRRIFEVLGGDLEGFRARPRISTLVTTASPLQVDGDILDVHLATASWGAPLEIYTMAIAGATAPVTLTGTLVQCLAEFLGVATVVQTVVPGAKLSGAPAPGCSTCATRRSRSVAWRTP